MRAGGVRDRGGRSLHELVEELAVAAVADTAVLCRLGHGRRLEVVAAKSWAAGALAVVESAPVDELGVPLADAVCTGAPVLLERDDAGGALAALPLTAGGEVVGALGLGFATARTFTADDRRLLVDLAAASAAALRDAASTAPTDDLVPALEALLESVPVGLALVDPDGRFRFTNRPFTRMGGGDAPALAELVDSVRVGDAPVVGVEVRGVGSPDSILLASGYPVDTGEGAWVGLVLSDVTARRRDERRFSDEGQIVETLHFVGRQLAGERDAARVTEAVTQAATLVTDADAAVFLAPDPDAPIVLASAGDAAPFLAAFDADLVAPTLHGGETVRVDDVGGRAGPGAVSFLGVPITARDGRSHGGLFLVHDKAGAFDERDERLVVGIAGQAAVALDDARLYEDERDARQRLAVLAEVGRVLGSSFDVDELLPRVAAVLVPWLVDGCVIDVTEVGGVHHSASVGRRPVTDDVTTVVEVPLEARDGVIGSLSLAIGPERRPPNGEDMTVLADLGRRIAVAVENARLFAHQRSVAITLQRSLLPDRLPAVPGVSMAARYLPGGIDVEIDVGGDWYDVLPFPDGTLGMAMGDVVGRGVRAAALMGQLRSALRAYAFEGHTPGACLTRLNALLEAITGGTLVTAVKGHLEPRTGRLLLANAGHPPPLVVHADGSTEFVAASLGVPLSTLADPDYVDVTIQLEPGALVAFYTDGLVEERDESLDEGFGRLVDAFGSGPVDDLEALCEHVLAKMGSDRAARDDTALLVVRLSSVR